jgi:hypothetical protein
MDAPSSNVLNHLMNTGIGLLFLLSESCVHLLHSKRNIEQDKIDKLQSISYSRKFRVLDLNILSVAAVNDLVKFVIQQVFHSQHRNVSNIEKFDTLKEYVCSYVYYASGGYPLYVIELTKIIAINISSLSDSLLSQLSPKSVPSNSHKSGCQALRISSPTESLDFCPDKFHQLISSRFLSKSIEDVVYEKLGKFNQPCQILLKIAAVACCYFGNTKGISMEMFEYLISEAPLTTNKPNSDDFGKDVSLDITISSLDYLEEACLLAKGQKEEEIAEDETKSPHKRKLDFDRWFASADNVDDIDFIRDEIVINLNQILLSEDFIHLIAADGKTVSSSMSSLHESSSDSFHLTPSEAFQPHSSFSAATTEDGDIQYVHDITLSTSNDRIYPSYDSSIILDNHRQKQHALYPRCESDNSLLSQHRCVLDTLYQEYSSVRFGFKLMTEAFILCQLLLDRQKEEIRQRLNIYLDNNN